MDAKSGEGYNSLLTAIVFISVVSLGIGLTYLLSRIGFESQIHKTVKTILFFLLLINGPLVPMLTRRKVIHRSSIFGSYALFLTLGIGLSIFAGMLISQSSSHIIVDTLIGISGLSAFCIVGNTLLRRTSIRYTLILSGLASLFTLWLSGRLWGPHILHPLFLEGLVAGRGFIDTLFHLSISQMIHTYGIASTGVDGLTSMHYHVGSHWLLVQWSNLLGLPLVEFFTIAYCTIVMPLFYFTILLLPLQLAQMFNRPLELDFRTPVGRTFWLLFFILNIRLLPDRALVNLAVWETFAFSPSFFLGLAFLFILLLIILQLWNQYDIRFQDVIFLILIPIAIGLLGWIKNSTMCLAIAGYAYVLWRQKQLKRLLAWIGLILSGIVSLWTLFNVTHFTSSGGFHLFAFLRTYIPLHLLPYHLLVYFAFLFFYMTIRISQRKIKSWSALIEAIKTRKLLDVEILILIAVFGAVPGMFLMIPDGSAHAFSDVQIRLAVPLILAQSGWISHWIADRNRNMNRILIILIISIIGWKTLSLVGFYIKGNLTLRSEIQNISSEFISPEKRSQFLTKLRTLDQMPLSGKRGTLIHISKSDTVFWNHFLDRGPNQKISLLVPALTGIAMLNGLPPDTMKISHYGFGYFTRRKRTLSDDKALCQTASEIGFPDVRIISFASIDRNPDVISCTIDTENSE
ncbi:hypothetical protein HQ585_18405 [candidate division KSB1 bacterium]|nr:hypothetical protein [candidate division KSB1 bacterium]